MTRTFFLVVLLGLFAPLFYAHAQSPLGPRDKGYKHEQNHPHYQKLYSKGLCHCKTGECRATIYRPAKSGVGVEIKIDGNWYDVPPDAMRDKQAVPPELWLDQAHVCAYPDGNGKYIIECAILNSGV